MAQQDESIETIVGPLLHIRQTVEFTAERVTAQQLDALADVARWSGSANNRQPWRFIVIHDAATIRSISRVGLPHTVTLSTAAAALAFVLPHDPQREVVDAYDDGRAAERVLMAASLLGLGAAISWVRPDVLAAVRGILEIPEDLMVRTIMAVGHPSEQARRRRSAPGAGRLPRAETVHRERWTRDPE